MNNKIIWIFSAENPMSIPSYIVGGIMPADYLKIKKVIYLNHNNANKFLLEHKPKIIILSKAFHSGVLELAKEAKSLNIKVISIFDDWHFENTNKEIEMRSRLNEELTKISEVVVTKTDSAAMIICQNTGILPKVIPDCIRYKTLKATNSFGYPFNISWFGNYTNHKTIIKAVKEITLCKNHVKLKIITNKIEKIKFLLKNVINNISITYLEWSVDLHKNIENSDIVIIPLFENNKSRVKSSNRIIDSLNMGKFVIINDNDQFKEFKDYCFFGNIGDGLEWLKNNKDKAIEMTSAGQKHVLKNYKLEVIANKWVSILNSVSF